MRALATDLYQLTMAAGYFHRGLADTTATFELFVRKLPKQRRYLVACGIEDALDYLEGLRFEDDDIAFLAELPAMRAAMTREFIDYLRDFRFRGDVRTVREGTVVFGGEPMVQVRGSIIEAQLVETFLLSAVNHGTMIASKAARVIRAAGGASVLEFGTRRTHPDAALSAARAAYLVGFAGTSNVEAGKRYGLPVLGTAAHSWTMAHDDEEQAFANYAATFPDSTILLIDTYDTLRGAERAAKVVGAKLKGVRIDSGDLVAQSRAVRGILDAHGLTHTKILASGDLNEHAIAELRAAGAPFDSYGVGTELVCSKDAPALGGVYKVVEWSRGGSSRAIAKFAEGKATYPGAHQVQRTITANGELHDVLALVDEPLRAGATPLLELRLVGGQRTGKVESLAEARARTMATLAALPSRLHDLAPSDGPQVTLAQSAALLRLVDEVRASVGVAG
ncbi:MAG: nicotinate phosphoribosyltransferase [Deltaproteobacteria bacterium]|nr:nicotinate phosphoribosyltransferase [Deltaproteobacteria bacterium]